MRERGGQEGAEREGGKRERVIDRARERGREKEGREFALERLVARLILSIFAIRLF